MPNLWLRAVYMALGSLSLAVGAIGLFLPLIPTTGPLLLAAFFFARSSDRFHRWLLSHPRFGPLIADYQAGRGIPRRVKVTAIVMMAAAFIYGAGWVVEHAAARAAMAAVGAAAIGYVLSIPVADRRSRRGS